MSYSSLEGIDPQSAGQRAFESRGGSEDPSSLPPNSAAYHQHLHQHGMYGGTMVASYPVAQQQQQPGTPTSASSTSSIKELHQINDSYYQQQQHIQQQTPVLPATNTDDISPPPPYPGA